MYVGSMHSEGKLRMGVIIDGKLYRSRSIKQKFGTTKKSVILAAHPDAQFVKQKSKDRYFYFRGDKRTRAKNRKAIEDLIKPYPKRDPASLEPSEVEDQQSAEVQNEHEQICLW